MMGIYLIKNKTDGKVYVGQAKDIYVRWDGHEEELNMGIHGNIYLQRAWDKYNGGKNFEFSILELVKDENYLTDCEEYWMDFVYKSRDRKNGYNIRHASLTQPLSDETKLNISINHGGAKLSKNEVLEVIELIKNGELYSEIAKKYNVSSGIILSIKRGKHYVYITKGPIRDEDINQNVLTKNKIKKRSETHSQAKFTEKEVLDIIERIKDGETLLGISKDYNVSKQVILRIKNGRNYRHITGGAIKDEDINQENLKRNLNKNRNIKEFTEKDIKTMIDKKKDGLTYKEIGKSFGCSANKARKLILDNDKSISVKKLGRKIDNNNRKLTPENVLEVLDLLEKGKTYGFIAKKFNVSNETIRRVKLKVGYKY